MTDSDDEALREGAAHDIRNVLATIAGWADLARAKQVPIEEALAAIQAAALTGQRTADVLMGAATDEPDVCDLGAVAEDVVRLLGPTARAKKVQLQVRSTFGPVYAALGRTDATRIAWNLALNAIQVLRTGEQVTLVVESTSQTGSLRVEDNGPGMDRQTQARVLQHRQSERPGGRGIGLSAVRQLVKAAGGTVSLDSAPGRGTSFRIDLPLGTPARRSSASGVTRAVQSVLVVEDDAGVRELVCTTLALRDLNVVAVGSASEAAKMEGSFDVALVDLTLGDGSGDDVIADLRARRVAQRCVLMSGMPSSPTPTLDGRPDHWLRKPFDSRQLLDALGVAAVEAAV